MQRVLDRGSPAPKDTPPAQLLHLWLQEHHGWWGKDYECQNTRKSAVKQSLPGVAAQTRQNKHNTHGHVSMEGGDVCRVPHLDKELQAGDCWKETLPLLGKNPFIYCLMQSGHPWAHINTNKQTKKQTKKAQTQQVASLYWHICMHTYMYVTIIIQ